MSKQKPAIGIDLGTTFSVACCVDADGKPRTIVNSEGEPTTASVVLMDPANIVVGREAVRAAVFEPLRIARLAKREMGEAWFSQTVAGHRFPPEVIQAFVLNKMKQDAETVLGPIESAVVTVPAYFDEPRRKATEDAARLAGIETIDIINEPTAAAIAYGVNQGFLTAEGTPRAPERVLVYDLGGGTFDVSLIEIANNAFKVIGTDGDVRLGGVDWDSRILNFVADQFREQYAIDPRDDPVAYQRLRNEAEEAKRSLSARENTTLSFDHQGHGLRMQITRAQFEDLTSDLLERTRFTSNSLVSDCQFNWTDVTRVLLVGGATRMPMVRRMLEAETGNVIDAALAADEAVAHGAAVYASLLQQAKHDGKSPVRISNVNSHPLGVLAIERQTGRSRRRILIPENTPLPVSSRSRFKTQKDGQSCVVVDVIEGGDDSGNNATHIGKCVVDNLPPDLPAGLTVEVKFRYAPNGRLGVIAELPDINRSADLEIKRAHGLSEDALRDWSVRVHELLANGCSATEDDPHSPSPIPTPESATVTDTSDAPAETLGEAPANEPSPPATTKIPPPVPQTSTSPTTAPKAPPPVPQTPPPPATPKGPPPVPPS